MEEILRDVQRGRHVLLTPAHWPIELLSSLQRGARRRRIRMQDRAPSFALLSALPITIIADIPRAGDLFALADQARLSVYDALYLSLALREKALLATGDAALARAAAERGVLLKTGKKHP